MMARIVSIHEYELAPGIRPADFEQAAADARHRGLFDLPGLCEHHFLRGMKGSRPGSYTAIWIYESGTRPRGSCLLRASQAAARGPRTSLPGSAPVASPSR
jgi:hypothetical protein